MESTAEALSLAQEVDGLRCFQQQDNGFQKYLARDRCEQVEINEGRERERERERDEGL